MLNPDFSEFIQLLNDNQVRYLVIGGYAVALHGYPRYTKDIDIWIEMSVDNATRSLAALAQLALPLWIYRPKILWSQIRSFSWAIHPTGLIC